MTHHMPQNRFERFVNITIHLVAWFYIFATPLLFMLQGETFHLENYGRRIMLPLTTCIIFYANYFWLVPRFIIRRRIKWFVCYNLLFLVVLTLARECYIAHFPPPIPFHGAPGPGMGMPHIHSHPINLEMVSRNCISTILAAGLAVSVRLSLLWRQAEEKRKEAELGRATAELQNLKNQISPHFLLNTLNNIYALTAIDSEKAQKAILSLSRMLRHLLYENQSHTVALSKETEFLRTYVELMSLRVAKNVDIRYEIDIPHNENPQVAPLIFISLVENAFKHGISATAPGFIHIRLSVDSDKRTLTFSVSNSHHPKNRHDKAGSGIGLRQVSRRLSLFYPDKHTWQHGPSPDGSRYVSTINIEYENGISKTASPTLKS